MQTLLKECTAGLSNSCQFLFPAIKQGSFWIQVQNGDAAFWDWLQSCHRIEDDDYCFFFGLKKLSESLVVCVFPLSGFSKFLKKVSPSSRPELIRAIVDCGFEHPSEVQHECIPQVGSKLWGGRVKKTWQKKGDRLDLPLTQDASGKFEGFGWVDPRDGCIQHQLMSRPFWERMSCVRRGLESGNSGIPSDEVASLGKVSRYIFFIIIS